ncbi:hypothetical protein JG688_00004307 [Phytophthora aleatoria]|uniref:Uncharacterized protein n=1 Tax=Phytophthora aleatoria TaxID=2496075 RepID=A0A8J5M9F6_9STRA|nr:hypothetical protein JG688_00004307 [Phytophthora aleatoria]
MAAAFTFLSPVSHARLSVTHVPPACTFTWTPVDPTSSRLHWTRSDAKLAPTPEPSTESTKSTKLQITSDQDQQLHQHTEDVPKSLIDDNDAAIIVYNPPQQELKLAFACHDVTVAVQKANAAITMLPADFTATCAYHEMSIVVYDAQRTTLTLAPSVEPLPALTKELYARLLSLLAANDPQIATAVLHERHDAIAIANAEATSLVDVEASGHKVQEDARAAHRPALRNRLCIQRVQPRVYDFQYDPKRKAVTADAKTRRSNGPTARHTPASAPTPPVLPRTNVTSRLFSYLKDATYLGHRADSKARRDQASAAATQRRWL